MASKVSLTTPKEFGPKPKSFYLVAKTPALLAGMAFPHSVDWNALSEQGIRWVVNLAESTPSYDPSPLRLLKASEMQNQSGGEILVDARWEGEILAKAVESVTARLELGEGVAVHCVGGTGRTGTVISCVLCRLGVPMSAVLDQMHAINQARIKGPGWTGWPESQWQRTVLEEYVSESGE